MMVNPRRLLSLNAEPAAVGPVVYWMHREMRARDNWGLLRALEVAAASSAPVCALFALDPDYPGATLRAWDFLLRGLEETARDLAGLGVPLFVRTGDPGREVSAFLREVEAGAVVTDFDPLRHKRRWMDAVAGTVAIAVEEADSRNVVPCRAASDKQEYAARTIRPRIHRLLPEFLEEFPEPEEPAPWPGEVPRVDWEGLRKEIAADASVGPVDWLRPGSRAGREMLDLFLDEKIGRYAEERNDPTKDALSNLSPYLHFGFVSAQRVALETGRLRGAGEGREAFLEELIVRRELADNFCLHNPHYDSHKGFPDWGAKTLARHRDDPREHVYTAREFEQAATSDPLWNAAQNEMVRRGKMHGHMRMYWAKKILEWTNTPEYAVRVAIELNDRYELDGRDPNGYTGVAWAIGGLHDRPWKERPVFGTVRFMSAAGARRKFDVDAYIDAWS